MDKFDTPEPKKIAPQLTVEQRQAMQPVDLLVQYIMPKLLDKVNYLEWSVKAELHAIKACVEQLKAHNGKLQEYADNLNRAVSDGLVAVNKRIDSIAEVNKNMLAIVHDGDKSEAQKPKRSRKKATDKNDGQQFDSDPKPASVAADINEPVSMTNVAQYDAQKDIWVPKVIDDVAITEGVVNAVIAGDPSYSMDVMAFIYDLSEDERKVLCDLFPAELVND